MVISTLQKHKGWWLPKLHLKNKHAQALVFHYAWSGYKALIVHIMTRDWWQNNRNVKKNTKITKILILLHHCFLQDLVRLEHNKLFEEAMFNSIVQECIIQILEEFWVWNVTYIMLQLSSLTDMHFNNLITVISHTITCPGWGNSLGR